MSMHAKSSGRRHRSAEYAATTARSVWSPPATSTLTISRGITSSSCSESSVTETRTDGVSWRCINSTRSRNCIGDDCTNSIGPMPASMRRTQPVSGTSSRTAMS
eukprot:Amastigsp_a508957_22.p5 type:complete len:104 gc:universal Amastigsp_a508957_22:1672-1361(-)